MLTLDQRLRSFATPWNAGEKPTPAGEITVFCCGKFWALLMCHIGQAFILKCRFEEMCNPLYSTDLTRSGYQLFPYLKKNLRGQTFRPMMNSSMCPKNSWRDSQKYFSLLQWKTLRSLQTALTEVVTMLKNKGMFIKKFLTALSYIAYMCILICQLSWFDEFHSRQRWHSREVTAVQGQELKFKHEDWHTVISQLITDVSQSVCVPFTCWYTCEGLCHRCLTVHSPPVTTWGSQCHALPPLLLTYCCVDMKFSTYRVT